MILMFYLIWLCTKRTTVEIRCSKAMGNPQELIGNFLNVLSLYYFILFNRFSR